MGVLLGVRSATSVDLVFIDVRVMFLLNGSVVSVRGVFSSCVYVLGEF